ncbi:YbaB/EbfC family nucleoid-associated protein [Amycolatopsis sp.]|uniref:YbaB/EbfC family nucleoid-associated protein n=1 Tax=Amycolatopsis sp. TaxID=37632 RepID=UPI002C29206D|nr:YbaB/EbfC family nucleoid-associated protein [Amycolatopsis sp.]HVV08998.1 YbaB/EbfC family nucleoid-associated protein [Amycolatopsis sp.]
MDADLYADYRQLAEDVRAAQDRMATIRVTAESDDGLISATVDSSGGLAELSLDPRVYHAPDSTALARTIVETIRRAAQNVLEERFAILARYLPADATPETSDLKLGPFLHELDREANGDRR